MLVTYPQSTFRSQHANCSLIENFTALLIGGGEWKLLALRPDKSGHLQSETEKNPYKSFETRTKAYNNSYHRSLPFGHSRTSARGSSKRPVQILRGRR